MMQHGRFAQLIGDINIRKGSQIVPKPSLV
jgi:hypothetical protein